MKSNSDSFCASAIQRIIERIIANGITVISYKPTHKNGSEFLHSKVANDLETIKAERDIIVVNGFGEEIPGDVAEKLHRRFLQKRLKLHTRKVFYR